MKHLHLIVSTGLPLEVFLDQAPALRKLLARAAGRAESDAARAACTALDIARQQDWPLAPLLARAEGLDAGSGYWLRADPIAFEVGMNGLLPRRPQPMLSPDEAAALAAALAPELALLGAELFTPDPQRWYLRLAAVPRLITRPLEPALERSMPPDWLAGADAPAFLRVMNGIQISLHQHPVNRAREAAGALSVNGLWLWGGGVRPALGECPDAVWGTGIMARAMALAAGRQASPPPARYSAVTSGTVVAVYEAADPAALDRDWIGPLSSALRWTRLRRLTLSLTGGTGQAASLTTKDFWSLP